MHEIDTSCQPVDHNPRANWFSKSEFTYSNRAARILKMKK